MEENYDVDNFKWNNEFANNRVRLIGTIVSEPVLYLNTRNMKYYMVFINTPTKQGHENLIPLVVNEQIVEKNNGFFYGKKVLVRGFLTTIRAKKNEMSIHDQCVMVKRITSNVPNFKYNNVGFVRGTMVGYAKINKDSGYSRAFLRVSIGRSFDPNVCMTTEYPLASHLEKLNMGSEVYFKFYLLGFNRTVPTRACLKAKVFIGTNDFENTPDEDLKNLDVNFKGNIVDKYVPKRDGYAADDDPSLVEMDEKLGLAQKFIKTLPPLDDCTPPPEKDPDGIFYID